MSISAPTSSTYPRGGSGGSLKSPAFLILWTVQAVTQTAQNVVNFGLLILAQTLTGSSAQVALIILSFSLPAVLFSTLAGVMVDRWEKRWVMVWSNAVRGAAVLSYVLVDAADQMYWVYGASFLFASAAQFFAPAQGALLPRLVGREKLIEANSLYNLTFMASQFLGFTVVGWLLIRTFGLETVWWLVAGIYALASLVIALAPLPSMRSEGGEGSAAVRMWSEWLEGWHFIATRRRMVITILQLSIANSVFLMLGTLGPAFVLQILRIRAEDLGLLLAPAGICTLLGALTVPRLATPHNRHAMIHAGLMGLGLSILAMALISPVASGLASLLGPDIGLTQVTASAVVLSMGFGFSAAFVVIPAQTVLQESSSDEIRGRVLSTFFTISNAAAFFPILLAGRIADVVGILETLGMVGGLILLVGVGSHVSYRRGRVPRSPATKNLPP